MKDTTRSKLQEEMQKIMDAEENTCECLIISKQTNKANGSVGVSLITHVKSPQSVLFFMAYIGGRLNLSKVFEPEFKEIADAMERERLLENVYGQD